MSERARHLRVKGWICLSLGLITLALYLPALRHAFLAYDDQQYVTENAQVQAGLTRQGVVWAFGPHAGNWHPLAWLSHMTDCQLYGLRPWGHHLTSVILHVANTLLLFLVLNRMTGALWRSALVAALFAWHPLHVESVAWVAERKDVLSALFFMLTLLAYGKYVTAGATRQEAGDKFKVQSSSLPRAILQPPSSCFYFLALFLFALGLMSKPMVVTLPFVLLLLDYWPLGRSAESKLEQAARQRVPRSQLVVEKLPFFALAGLCCVLTLSAQRPAMVSTAGLQVPQRVEHALTAYLHYLGTLIVPGRLAVYYPYAKEVSAAEAGLAGVVLVVLTALVLRFATRQPHLATGWLWFLGTLVPVIGLVQVGDQAWADRYTYLPSIGLFVAVVWSLSELVERGQVARTGLRWLAAALGLGLLIGTSWQLRYWKDTRTLFEHAARVTQNNPLATTMLGSLLAKEGKLDQAIEYYRTALRYTPDFPEAHFFLGHAFDQQGKLDEAIAEFKKALWFKPTQEQTHIFLGSALAKQNKPELAAAQYLAALQLNPLSALAHNNYAKLLHAQGRFDDAIGHYTAALKFDPGLSQAHNNLGVLLLQKGQLAEGTRQLREALRLKPGEAESQLNLAQGLVEQEQWSEAADLFAKTVASATSDPNVHYRFAVALAHLQRTREAMSHYASALLLRPDFPAALDGLSWILATAEDPQFRNGAQSIGMAERACELTGRRDPDKLKTLAAAYAEVGRFSEASATAQTAWELAGQAGRKGLADECRFMVEQFKASKPWRAER